MSEWIKNLVAKVKKVATKVIERIKQFTAKAVEYSQQEITVHLFPGVQYTGKRIIAATLKELSILFALFIYSNLLIAVRAVFSGIMMYILVYTLALLFISYIIYLY